MVFMGIFLVTAYTFFALPPGSDSDAHKQFRKSIQKKRHRKDISFKKSPTSPMAAVKRLPVKEGKKEQKTFVIEKNRDISLCSEEVPGVKFSLINKKGHWSWENPLSGTAGVTCTAAGKPVPSGSLLPEQAMFRLECCLVKVYTSKDGLVLMVYDSMREELKNFSHLIYFPPDPAYAVPAVLKKFPSITPVTMLTSRNLKKTFYRYASIHFNAAGKNRQLTAYKFSLKGHTLFIPFADTTNGKETYYSGRFLEIPEPRQANFILDFNLCFNPLCNYSPAFNCPLPPMENILDIPIKAGEKTYPH